MNNIETENFSASRSKTESGIVRIAQAQMPVTTDRSACLSYLEASAEKASSQRADFLLLPEMFCFPYNTAYIFDPAGRQIAKHRKMHLFDIQVQGGQHFRESDVLSPGSSVTVFDTSFGVFGLAVCFDIRFPELFRLMALKGALAVLVPAAFNMTTGPMHWELLFRSQALNNQLFTAGTAPARNADASYVSWGHSIVAGPWGNVISQMDAGEDFQITEIDLRETRKAREQIPALSGRRTDVYTLTER